MTSITFTRHSDGRITADGAPYDILVSPELKDVLVKHKAIAEIQLLEGRWLQVQVSNGRCTYVRLGADRVYRGDWFRLIHAQWYR